MSGGLSIRLKPHEKFLINGAVIENGDRRTKIYIRSPNVNILRLCDALHPSEATTPVKSLYYKAQLVVIGELTTSDGAQQIIPSLRALRDAFLGDEYGLIIDTAVAAVSNDDFYKTMKLLKKLIPVEEKLLMIAKAKGLAPIAQNEMPCSSQQQA